jgi:hypothetical protein
MDRTLITHTKALDLTRPVTFVSNAKYDADLGVSLEWGGGGLHTPRLCLVFRLVLTTS